MIIVSIVGPSMQQALSQVVGSTPYADMFEFRLDLIDRPNIAGLLSSTRKPTVVTCRPLREGGRFNGTERERIGILELASVFGADFVDVELNTSPQIVYEFIRRRKETAVIVSHHLMDGTIFDTARIYRALHATGADVIKLAFSTDDSYENHLAFDFLARARTDRRKAIVVAMGEAGEPSRILYKKFGGWATYAATEDGQSTASGQISGSQLKNLYHTHTVTRTTQVYGVVGNPVKQSKGISLHNPLFWKVKQNKVYCRFQVRDMDRFMEHLAPHLSGFSVTLPYKERVGEHLDRVDPTSKAIGAVNTVVRRGRYLVGTNTDAPGALDAIEKVARVKGRRLLILGAGGAARAIAYEARRRGAAVLITNRTPSKAGQLAREFGLGVLSWGSIRKTDFDILVNATPIGMFPNSDASPVPKSILRKKIVFDCVYNPPITKLLRDAKSVGARIIGGTEMYVNQAALQSAIYTGTKPNIRLMKKLLSEV